MLHTESSPASRPTVAVVLCTYNGAKHIDEQLRSFAMQTWPIHLRVFDDASSDDTVERVKNHCHTPHDQLYRNTQNLGFVANFSRGIQAALNDGYDYIALADQDDVWHSQKIAESMRQAIAAENDLGKTTPVLVHSDLAVIDEKGVEIADSYLNFRGYGLSRARNLPLILGQNGVMGNTILMNRQLAQLVLPFPERLHVHDYWIAVLAELYGERRYIDLPLVRYRVHRNNASNTADSLQVGGNVRPIPIRIKARITQLLRRNYRLPFKEDSRRHVINDLLQPVPYRPPLSADQRSVLSEFLDYLRLAKPRVTLLKRMLRAGYIKRGWKARMGFTLALLTTQRYRSTEN